MFIRCVFIATVQMENTRFHWSKVANFQTRFSINSRFKLYVCLSMWIFFVVQQNSRLEGLHRLMLQVFVCHAFLWSRSCDQCICSSYIYRRNRSHLYNVPERLQTNVGEELGPAKMASPTTPYPDKPKLSTITDWITRTECHSCIRYVTCVNKWSWPRYYENG